MTVVPGLALAATAWWWLFRAGGRGHFWTRALLAGTAIGGYALVAQRASLARLFDVTAADLVLGLVAAAVLYGVFWVGDRVLLAMLPAVATEIGDLYQVRATATPAVMAAALVLVGTCEEIFWRGFVQDRAGLAVAVVAYTLVHVWERKAALILAAATGGLFWGALFAGRGTLVAPILSHVLWDLAVIVWFPFRGEPARATK